MKQIKFLILLLLQTLILNAQKIAVNEYAAIDKKVLEMPDSLATTTQGIADYVKTTFVSEKSKARAAFIWVAENIQYDIENMYAINFYESKEDKVNKPLATKKGICENYAALFNDICLKCGIKCFVVEGYTKQNGFTDYIPHAWCAAYIDTAWFMFDPTWGSGYISNEKFYKKINNTYFAARPSVLIKTHMPFDYMWQFLNYPITNQQFYEGKTIQNTATSFFNYSDSIETYEHQNHIEQLTASARRIEKNGMKNSMLFDRLQHIKFEIENEKIDAENKKQAKAVSFYNDAVSYYNDAVKHFNEFIEYRNHQFKPDKTDAEIQAMMDTVNVNVTRAQNNTRQIEYPDASLEKFLSQLVSSIADIDSKVKEQQNWLNTYFSKPKSKRKSMFYEKKISWFGVPLN